MFYKGFSAIVTVLAVALLAGGVAYVVIEKPFNGDTEIELTLNPPDEGVSQPDPYPFAPSLTPTPMPTQSTTIGCFVLEQTEVSGPDNSFFLTVGEVRNPSGECRSYFLDTRTGEQVSPTELGADDRQYVTAFSCLPGGTIEGCQVPDIEYSYTYSEYGDGNAAMQVRDAILIDIFTQLFARKRSVYTVDDIEKLGGALAAWADRTHSIVYLNDEPLLIEGGNAGGHSPVEMPSLQHSSWPGFINTSTYELYARWERVLTYDGCRDGFVASYLRDMSPGEYSCTDTIPSSCGWSGLFPTTTGQLADDLSCLGVITFRETSWGSE